jgi:hypothetical protein
VPGSDWLWQGPYGTTMAGVRLEEELRAGARLDCNNTLS